MCWVGASRQAMRSSCDIGHRVRQFTRRVRTERAIDSDPDLLTRAARGAAWLLDLPLAGRLADAAMAQAQGWKRISFAPMCCRSSAAARRPTAYWPRPNARAERHRPLEDRFRACHEQVLHARRSRGCQELDRRRSPQHTAAGTPVVSMHFSSFTGQRWVSRRWSCR